MMKKLIVNLMLGLTLFSCTKEADLTLKEDLDQEESGSLPEGTQKWQLVKTFGSIINSQQTGSNMPYQEYYLLNADSTFVKSRTQDGKLTKAEGTYSINNSNDKEYFKLTYATGIELIQNCTGTDIEFLYKVSQDNLQGTGHACDRLGHKYKLVK
jgi:hypothetical protein